MATINKNLLGIMFSGASLALASAPWKGNLRAVYGFNGAGSGYTTFKPASSFNSLTALVPDGVYILDVLTPGFDLPGAVLSAGSPPAVAAVIDKALMGFLFGGAAALGLASAPWKNNVGSIYGFNGAGTGYTTFKPSSTFNSLTQLVADGVYIISSTTPNFALPGAVLVAPAAVLPSSQYVQSFVSMVEAAGGSVAPAYQSALMVLEADLKGAGIWADCDVINVFLPGVAESAFNFRSPGAFHVTYPNGILADEKGVTADGVNQFYDTNFQPATHAAGRDNDLAVDYLETEYSPDGTLPFSFGATDWGGHNFSVLRGGVLEDKATAQAFLNTNQAGPLGALLNAKSFITAQRGPGRQMLYQFGRPVVENTTPVNGLVGNNFTLYGLGKNNGGNVQYPMSGTHGHLVIRRAMSDAKVELLNQYLHKYHIATGRLPRADVFMGDSITHGLNVAKSWARSLTELRGTMMQNWAVSGQVGDYYLADPWGADKQVPTYNAAIHERIVFAHGTNDIISNITPAQFAANTAALLSMAVSRGWPGSSIIVIPAFYQRGDSGNVARDAYLQAVTPEVDRVGAVLFNIYEEMRARPDADTDFFPAADGTHFNAAGALFVAQRLFAVTGKPAQ